MRNGNLFCVIRGPVTVIAIGTLFALDHFTPYRIGQTWPSLLILFGLLTLLCRRREPAGSAAGDLR